MTKKASNKAIEDYKTARSVFWQSLYPQGGVTLYCQQRFSTPHGRGINVEHVFPMSWVTKAMNCGTRKQCRQKSAVFSQIEADLHNLYPARTDVNSDRSSFRFGEVAGESRHYGQSCDFEVNHSGRVVEPTPDVRGDIARSMFYMAYQYKEQGLRIFKAQGRLLADWHQSDPPSDEEKARNEKIASLQGNDNPFITTPEMVGIKKDAFY
jgi:deoxyribonuclease-1